MCTTILNKVYRYLYIMFFSHFSSFLQLFLSVLSLYAFVISKFMKYFYKFHRLGVFEGKGTLGKLKLKRRMQSGRDRTEDKKMMSDKWLCFSVQTYVLYIGEIFHYPHTEFLTLYQPHPFQQICIFCAVSSRGFFFPA